MICTGFCVHPHSKILAYGWWLSPKDIIKKGRDVYASDDGTWRDCDPSWDGMHVEDLSNCVIVRLTHLPHD